MRKNDKKIDNKLRQLLTEVCDFALHNSPGYKWITHSVNYNRFPESLVITCTFEDKLSADNAEQEKVLLTVIQQKLNSASIKLLTPSKQVNFTC